MELINQVEQYIKEADIAESDKQLWFAHLKNAPEEYLQILINVFQKYPEHFGWLNENFKQKIKFFHNQQGNELKRLFEEEKEYFNKIADKKE